MPILQRTHGDSRSSEQIAMFLRNVGQGPLFNLSIKPTKGFIVGQQADKDGQTVYVINAYKNQIEWEGDNTAVVTYSYQDMYSRKFTAKHKIYNTPEKGFDFDREVTIPKKATS